MIPKALSGVLGIFVLSGCAPFSPFDASQCRDGSFTGFVVDTISDGMSGYSMDFEDDDANDTLRSRTAELREVAGCASITGNIRTQARGTILEHLFALKELRGDDTEVIELASGGQISPFVGRFELFASGSSAALGGLEALERVHSLHLSGQGIDNLSALSGLRQIDSELCLTNTLMPTLSPLAALQGLQRVSISDNPELQDITAIANFGSLISLGLSTLNALIDLADLDGLEAVNELFISGNQHLQSLAGLENTTLGGVSNTIEAYFGDAAPQLYIVGNKSLTDISALEGLSGTVQHLSIKDNAQLTDLSPLYGIQSIRSRLEMGGGAMTCEMIKGFVEAIGAANIATSLASDDPYGKIWICGNGLDGSCLGDDVTWTYTDKPCYCQGCGYPQADCGYY